MFISSGTKSALGEAGSWIFAGCCIVATLIYFDELKAAFSPLAGGRQAVASGTNVGTAEPMPSQPVPTRSSSGYEVRLNAGPNGHYQTQARVNGRTIDVLVDTGATYVGLTYEDAERAGIFVNDSDFKYRVQTANGYSRIAVVDIGKVSIGDIEVRNVKATVAQPGKLHVTLLGMSFLSKLRRAEMRRGQLVLEN